MQLRRLIDGCQQTSLRSRAQSASVCSMVEELQMPQRGPRGVRDVPAEQFIRAYAEHLKANDKIQLPSWVDIVKTAPFKELAPYDPDWYYIRAASLARKVYMRQNIGVGTFARQYGGRNKRKGAVPEHFAKASRGLIRHILKQLEDIDVVSKSTQTKGGRAITPNGQRDLDLIAARIQRSTRDEADFEEE